MVTHRAVDEIPATVAHELAGITYRQLDYWARRGWVTPSVDQGVGRAGRRLYSRSDILRLAALGHFGRSGLDIGRIGPALARLHIPPDEDVLVVVSDGITVTVTPGPALREQVGRPGVHAVFDSAPFRRRLSPGRARSQEVQSA